MNEKTLPVLSILYEALLLPIKYFNPLVRVGLPLIFCGVFWIVWSNYFSENGIGVFSIIIGVCFLIVFLISLVAAIVGCHRIFIMGPNAIKEDTLLNWSGNEIRYVGWWVLIAICAIIISIPINLLVTPLLYTFFQNTLENYVLALVFVGLANIPIYYVVSRIALVLPSSAIGNRGEGLDRSWSLSVNNGWRLTFLIGLLPFLLDLLYNLLPTQDSVLYSLFIWALWLVVGAIEVGLLSLSYRYLDNQEVSK